MSKKLIVLLIIFSTVLTGLSLVVRIRSDNFKPLQDLLVVHSQPSLDPSLLLTLVSQYRLDNHLSALTSSSDLCYIAQVRAKEIPTDWSHNGIKPIWSSVLGRSFPYMGENLAKDYNTNQAVLDAWIKSPEHKANLDNPHYSQACVAINGSYVVMEYGGN